MIDHDTVDSNQDERPNLSNSPGLDPKLAFIEILQRDSGLAFRLTKRPRQCWTVERAFTLSGDWIKFTLK